jgi:Immunity protein 27
VPFLTELNDAWTLRDGKMVAEGEAKTIDELLRTKLVVILEGNWATLYRHKDTNELWDLVYPQSEMYGGGPRRLRRLDHEDPEKWDPYSH